MYWYWDEHFRRILTPVDIQPDPRVKEVDDIVVFVAHLGHLLGGPLAQTNSVAISPATKMKATRHPDHIEQ